jgi:predicted patatin/cPLA2 family phospholipase
MRGVFTAGALCGLEALGARSAFDVIHGSSGGAVNAAYFLAGQVPLGTSIYYEDLNRREFIDFRRLLRGTALGLDYCFDEVVAVRKRLDLAAVRFHPTPLVTHVTDAETADPQSLSQHELDSDLELLRLLKASAAMPLVYRKPIWLRGRRVVDGALFNPVPLAPALAQGTTDTLVLLSRPLAWSERPPQAWTVPLVLRSVGARSAAHVARVWRQSQEELARTLALLRAADEPPAGTAPALAVIAPPVDFPVTRWTTDRERLLHAAGAGAEAVFSAFGVPESQRPALVARALAVS